MPKLAAPDTTKTPTASQDTAGAFGCADCWELAPEGGVGALQHHGGVGHVAEVAQAHRGLVQAVDVQAGHGAGENAVEHGWHLSFGFVAGVSCPRPTSSVCRDLLL